MSHAAEIAQGQRFAFGQNWARFLEVLNPERILQAEQSLQAMLGLSSLAGKTFLDVGSGSGLFSLAARRLGAKVRSFDYDPASVACTAELRKRYFPDDTDWVVEEASVLDDGFMTSLGTYDIVYSWGVLHHTGQMWKAIENASCRVAEGGLLFIAIYNDQGWASRMWTHVKKAYVASLGPLKYAILLPSFAVLWGPRMTIDLVTKASPLKTWRAYADRGGRGMHPWRDVVDWVGGYPFEVAKPEEIFEFHHKRGFNLRNMITCAGGLGCNQFVFYRTAAVSAS